MEIVLDKRLHIILCKKELVDLENGKNCIEWITDIEGEVIEVVVSCDSDLKIYDDGEYLVKIK